ncbi:MAG: hypothetical protein BWY70_01169 [Bacteroidetes bacterium ADurb.Bin408]|nr:MAG: hypothetical protein BWY70_01169 [Bacteroidetes bacterium ADurb.Bin408]
MKNLKKISTALLITIILFSTSCLKDQTPTKTLMEGVWEVTEAYNENGENILPQIGFPVSVFHLSSDNTVISSAGPMIMYIVYGKNKYTEIASQIDQVMNYASLDFNGGEFFVGGGVQSRFTLEMKLEGLPGQKTLTTLLDLLGITNDYWDVVIYHKFMDVYVEIDESKETMTWEFDNATHAIYNTKDNYGNYILWQGWPVQNFSKCRFVLTKRVKDIKEVISDHL